MATKKTTCPISRQEFREHAEPMKVEINGWHVLANVKEFSTGSFGWYVNGKMDVEIAGKTCTVQVGINLTVVGSKELPKDAEPPTS